MPDVTLPTDGELSWGDPLNAVLSQIDTDALNALSNIANHAANIPSDPHGDRAYAQSLVSPITSGTNQANGYVKLDSTGHIPANLITGTQAGGLYTQVYDAVGLFGMFTGTSDTSTQLQNALNAAANAGGGIVYVGPGTYSLGNYVIIGSNTWLLLAEGCILQRITGSSNPPYIISNVKFGTNNTPATNFKITGGKLDAVGTQNLSSACTPIFVIQATKVEIRDMWINNVFNNPAIELNGSTIVRVDFCHFNGTGSGITQPTVPCIRLNSSDATTTPAGLLNSLYNGSVCQIIKITDCEISGTGSNFGAYGSFCGTDLISSHKNNDIAITAVSTRYPSQNFNPIVTANWFNYTIDNCNFNETTSTNVGSAWQTMTLKNSFTVGNDQNSNSYPPQFRMMPNGEVALRGTVFTPGSGGIVGITFATLPSAFGNNSFNLISATVSQPNGNHLGSVTLDSSGNLQLQGTFVPAIGVALDGAALRIDH